MLLESETSRRLRRKRLCLNIGTLWFKTFKTVKAMATLLVEKVCSITKYISIYSLFVSWKKAKCFTKTHEIQVLIFAFYMYILKSGVCDQLTCSISVTSSYLIQNYLVITFRRSTEQIKIYL
jgi:hypothetical protein